MVASSVVVTSYHRPVVPSAVTSLRTDLIPVVRRRAFAVRQMAELIILVITFHEKFFGENSTVELLSFEVLDSSLVGVQMRNFPLDKKVKYLN